MKWGVWSIPPLTGLMSDLPARFQVWAESGDIVKYDTKEEAEEWAKECGTCVVTKWKYEVREIKEEENKLK